jgi:hypothetical protein
MKLFLWIFILIAVTSCHNGSSGNDGHLSTGDTSVSGAIITDTTGAAGMNADTTGMGHAK